MRKYILILSCAMLTMIFATCTLFDARKTLHRGSGTQGPFTSSPPGVSAPPEDPVSPSNVPVSPPSAPASPVVPTRASQYPDLIGTWKLPTENPSIASLPSIQIELKRSIEITADFDVLIERIDGSIKDTRATPLFQAIEGIQVETYTIVTITDSQLQLTTKETQGVFTERADIKDLLAQFPITEADLDFVAPRMIGTTLDVPYTYSSAAQTLALDWKSDGNGAEYTKKSSSP